MISPELSTIQQKAPEAEELAAQVAEFLANGGVIETKKGFPLKPAAKKYGRMSPPVARPPAPRRRTKEAMQAAAPQDVIQDRCNARAEQVEVVRKLAETMTITDVMRETSLSIYRLRKMARVHGFEFKAFSPASNLIPYQHDPVADALNVVRIKAARDRGISQKAAVAELGMSNTMINRLIREFDIDYPLQGPSAQ
ncbi:hypothetical protein GE543_15080 [Pseudomonas sp. SZ57]|uniref:hypothetical protein n=1 Tax=Pseudomonas TaxID=286 RepID=UPI000736E5BA|nr:MULTISPECIES: hypothetical protein [Pseudomonas]KTB83008.1 hypothetical protein AO069_04180 [Pseudomonas syringae pv. syringae PD2774]KWS08264.1 hypothetical protein AL064_01980 [Pseudomonas syringae pv. syringae]KWS21139.1 hypothetical protein AL062_20345 [Pseudomonas syringae pv. syringae]MCH5515471.1 hypothetical protein [Pseudomonas syringae pv. syringae]MCH5548120.1 hypothetical protein [Pseudomonas syringae pv. syringae]